VHNYILSNDIKTIRHFQRLLGEVLLSNFAAQERDRQTNLSNLKTGACLLCAMLPVLKLNLFGVIDVIESSEDGVLESCDDVVRKLFPVRAFYVILDINAQHAVHCFPRLHVRFSKMIAQYVCGCCRRQ